MSTTVPPPAAYAPVNQLAADQEVLVRHLAERARGRLAGDAPDMAFITEQPPSQLLQLGVLQPLPWVHSDSGVTPEQYARERNSPPSHIGLTFILRPDPGATEAHLGLEAAFLFFVQRYPERLAQAEHQGSGSGARTTLLEVFERQRIAADRLDLTLDLCERTGRTELDLGDAIEPQLRPVLDDPKTVYPFSAVGQRLDEHAVAGTDEEYWQAIKKAEYPEVRAKRPHETPKGLIEVTWRKQVNGDVRVQVTLWNKTIAPLKPGKRKAGEQPTMYRDLHFFDAKLQVFEVDVPATTTQFRETPKGFRYDHLRAVETTGVNCVGRRLDTIEHPDRPLATETFPLFRQSRIEQNDDGAVQMAFDELRGPGALAALGRIANAMDDYEALWRRQLASWPNPSTLSQATKALTAFQRADIALFRRGLQCLRDDERLLAAFQAANEVFHRIDSAKPADRQFKTWRLFQVVFQVCQLPALRAREADLSVEAALRAHLDICDVLWFPTGGGKTEAYVGLIIVALFYGRLRGKKRGVTAVLRFPLRMLSVQQLQRILDVLWWTERHRRELVDANTVVAGGDYTGDEFLLGYWVGRDNMPNSLTSTYADNDRDNIGYWVNLAKNAPEELAEQRIITRCPNPACGGGDIALVPDAAEVRLRHICRRCEDVLPLVVTDDEVYRYLPGVLVCTVDKLAHVARANEMVGVFGGPAYRCPKHGYFNNHQLVWKPGGGPPERDDRCLGAQFCTVEKADYEVVPDTHDPAPELHVQDELHLLEEELGSLDAHYETLFELAGIELGSGLPTKLLAASATVESVEEQVRQLYARGSRVFPSQGSQLGESFYVRTTPAARRLYFGVLPYRMDPAEFGERVQAYLHEAVIAMHEDLPGTLAALQNEGLDAGRESAWLAGQLAHYELTLGYVNRKQDAERISTELARREMPPTGEAIEVETLVAEHTTLARISAVLNRVEDQYAATPDRTDRLRALVATSIVSHGVDLNALNLMVLNGMTPSVAGYVQASSRSGRTHVGLIIVGYDRRKARERSFFQYFLKYHEFLDRLITPVPVNRFAKFGVHWTVPGVMSTLLTLVYQRERQKLQGVNAQTPRVTLSNAKELRTWLGSGEPPASPKDPHILARLLRALGLGKTIHVEDAAGNVTLQPVFDPIWEGSLRETVEREFNVQMTMLKADTGKNSTSQKFNPTPLASFRSVEEPIDFASLADTAGIEAALVEARSGPRSPGSGASSSGSGRSIPNGKKGS